MRRLDAIHTRHECGEYSFARAEPSVASRAPMMRLAKSASLKGFPSSLAKRGMCLRLSPCTGRRRSISRNHLAAFMASSWKGSMIGSVPWHVPNWSHFEPFGASIAKSPSHMARSRDSCGSMCILPLRSYVTAARVNQSFQSTSPWSSVDSPFLDPTLRLMTIHARTMKHVQSLRFHCMPFTVLPGSSVMASTLATIAGVTGSTRLALSFSIP